MDKESDSETVVDCREHVLYCGVTQTGKTTLAREHARLLVKHGYDVVVYDPVLTATAGGGWPEHAEVFSDVNKFLRKLHSIRGEPDRPVFVFVDESADIFSHSNTESIHIPRKVRHQYVYLRLLTNRPKMLHPHVRTQCARAYMLRLSTDDAKMLCADFGHGSSVADTPLDKGDVVMLVSGRQSIDSFNVFDYINQPNQLESEE